MVYFPYLFTQLCLPVICACVWIFRTERKILLKFFYNAKKVSLPNGKSISWCFELALYLKLLQILLLPWRQKKARENLILYHATLLINPWSSSPSYLFDVWVACIYIQKYFLWGKWAQFKIIVMMQKNLCTTCVYCCKLRNSTQYNSSNRHDNKVHLNLWLNELAEIWLNL